MLTNSLFGLATMAVCFIIEAVLVLVALRYYSRHKPALENLSFISAMRLMISVLTVLVIGVLSQVGVWAVLFYMLGEFSQYDVAFYHSAVNFSTLGYGDIVMSDQYRLLGPLQAINGVIMIGVSTAVMMAFINDMLETSVPVLKSAQKEH